MLIYYKRILIFNLNVWNINIYGSLHGKWDFTAICVHVPYTLKKNHTLNFFIFIHQFLLVFIWMMSVGLIMNYNVIIYFFSFFFLTECGGIFNLDSNPLDLKSANYPNPFDSNSDCVYTILVKCIIILVFYPIFCYYYYYQKYFIVFGPVS